MSDVNKVQQAPPCNDVHTATNIQGSQGYGSDAPQVPVSALQLKENEHTAGLNPSLQTPLLQHVSTAANSVINVNGACMILHKLHVH